MKLFWGVGELDQDLKDLETALESVLVPVQPRTSFVQDLRRQLAAQHSYAVPENEGERQRYFLIAAAGFVGGALALALGIRTIITLLSALGLLHQMRGQLPAKSTSRINPAM